MVGVRLDEENKYIWRVNTLLEELRLGNKKLQEPFKGA
jgi:hypothetical protein